MLTISRRANECFRFCGNNGLITGFEKLRSACLSACSGVGLQGHFSHFVNGEGREVEFLSDGSHDEVNTASAERVGRC